MRDEPPEIFKKGDLVSITFEGRTVDGVIALASPNGVSLAVKFEALLGPWAGGVALLWQKDKGGFYDLLSEPHRFFVKRRKSTS